MLEIKDLVVKYDKVLALKGVSLSLKEGSITALIGTNGAGKTSLLKAVTRLIKPAEGSITYHGEVISNKGADKIVKMGISMVPEGRKIFPIMSVRDNLLLGAYSRTGKKEIFQDLEKIYERFPRVKERMHQQAGTLSGGEQQMVVIGRALMSRPKTLLLDEPSLGLAPLIIQEIMSAVRDINNEGVSVFLVEQNSRMALKISDYTYVMEVGNIKLEGKSTDLLENPEVKRIYLGG